MQCPKCNTEMARKGFTEYGRVRFQCPACHHQEFPLPDEVADDQECTCNAETATWSEERQMYVCSGCGLPMPESWYEDWPREQDTICPRCGGDGLEDDITPCDHCDGAGYEWWR